MPAKKRKWSGSKWCRKDKRLAVYLRDGASCVYCGRDASTGAVLSLDHVVAHNKGGSNHESNLVTSCKSCNSSKQDLSTRAWYAVLRRTWGKAHVEEVKRRVSRRELPLAPYRRRAKLVLESLEPGSYDNYGQVANDA